MAVGWVEPCEAHRHALAELVTPQLCQLCKRLILPLPKNVFIKTCRASPRRIPRWPPDEPVEKGDCPFPTTDLPTIHRHRRQGLSPFSTRIRDPLLPARILQRASSAEPQHRPQLHQTQVRRNPPPTST